MTQHFLVQLIHLMKLAIKNITSEINNELSKINEWLKINKLSLNKSKTKYMISKKQQANVVKPILQIDGINIESVDNFNSLGLTVDSRMTWNNHTTNKSYQINAQEPLAY